MSLFESPGIGGFDVSRETFERFEIFAQLLTKWNPVINLVSRTTLDDLWTRHFVDSIQIFDCVEAVNSWVDMGTGGGFPGAVVAILAKEKKPELAVSLVESDQRKATFLRTVMRETGVKATVLAKRIEAVDPLDASVLSARALADLGQLLGFAERHLNENGTALFQKGATWEKEVEAARAGWHFDLEKITSVTEPEAAILKIRNIARV